MAAAWHSQVSPSLVQLQPQACYLSSTTPATHHPTRTPKGTYLDEEDVISAASARRDDGLTYYTYEINAPYGTNGPHTVSACTVKVPAGCFWQRPACGCLWLWCGVGALGAGVPLDLMYVSLGPVLPLSNLISCAPPNLLRPQGDLALLFVVGANDKQWARHEGTLRKIVDSFRA